MGTHAQRVAVFIGVTPCGQGQREDGNFHTTGIYLQPVQVVGQHGIHGLFGTQPFSRHAHGNQQQEGCHQKVAGAAAGIEQLELGQRVGPAFKAASGRRAVFQRAQIRQGHRTGGVGGALSVPCVPPRTQRVVQQKIHHVRLCEELGDGGQLVCADLHFRGVHLLFALGLPELVHPAQAVAGLKHVGCKRGQQALQFTLVLGGKAQFKHRAVRLEHLRQHARGQLARQLPLGFGPQVHGGVGFLHQGCTVFQRHRCAHFPQQQPVFSQKAGKQHAMPVLVGDFPHEMLHIHSPILIADITQYASVRPQFSS